MASNAPVKTTESTPKIGLKVDDLTAINAGLGQVLSDTFTLYLKTHGYHWNVTGPHFRSLHLLFEEQYQELWAAADVLAERMRALGSGAPGSMAEFLEHASIVDDERTTDAMTMVENLARDHETLARLIRPLVEVAEDAGDGATADLFNARLAAHEQAAWMLRSFAA
ncbi:Dps family protein [Demequina lignilytica]|uniref:DNA starvation/stationary phase protection protein n=1 Tax=Demequina lignilytica TaxID=3051663 RepID=A0AAW7M872_9MICO|nr:MULTISPECIES: DNA starvation/stationary phase protection protein [unclassified Demequina]MDN4479247.1 DNA starvation/stationary phase protection protein [Demequina sp. SYSU T00039-1]MDN4483117.1 DNA starvation/stationary phase protection protein [Demequina sp. SYSU T0a273]MDN4487565.1 DNA starvation/stationary phase protection protein [Demequina sp. SYSU T00039]MDN4490965.1 DNA starvation/stationary phase protection protein [Demequina sp. SYSU T00068]